MNELLRNFIIGGVIISIISFSIKKLDENKGALLISLPISFYITSIINYFTMNNKTKIIHLTKNILKYITASASVYLSLYLLLKYTSMNIIYSCIISFIVWLIVAITIYFIDRQ